MAAPYVRDEKNTQSNPWVSKSRASGLTRKQAEKPPKKFYVIKYYAYSELKSALQ
jgi:hypothetical protein